MTTFPVVDLSNFGAGTRQDKEELGGRIDEICRETGFLAIVGHGVPDEVISRS